MLTLASLGTIAANEGGGGARMDWAIVSVSSRCSASIQSAKAIILSIGISLDRASSLGNSTGRVKFAVQDPSESVTCRRLHGHLSVFPHIVDQLGEARLAGRLSREIVKSVNTFLRGRVQGQRRRSPPVFEHR